MVTTLIPCSRGPTTLYARMRGPSPSVETDVSGSPDAVDVPFESRSCITPVPPA
jgi:hypothetical protein